MLLAQQNEPIIAYVFKYLNNKKDFILNDLGLLKRFRKQLNVSHSGILLWRNKIVLPEVFHADVLRICHDHPSSGHFGIDRTWSNLTKYYFWPGAHNDVVNWVRSCIPCNEFNTSTYIRRPLQPICVDNRFELVWPFLPKNVHGLL